MGAQRGKAWIEVAFAEAIGNLAALTDWTCQQIMAIQTSTVV